MPSVKTQSLNVSPVRHLTGLVVRQDAEDGEGDLLLVGDEDEALVADRAVRLAAHVP